MAHLPGVLAELRSELEGKPSIAAAGFFGSASTGDPKLGSMNLGSRLFSELVKAGLLHEVSEDYSVIGVDEIAFSV